MAVKLKRNVFLKIVLTCLLVTVVLSFLLGLIPLVNVNDCTCAEKNSGKFYKSSEIDKSSSDHVLAVIVPFRDRFEELLIFVPYIHKFLNHQHVNHKIYIINQIDNHRFNRASLINVGYLLSKNECDYIAMHDVDLLPLNPQLNYTYPKQSPFHIASPEFHPRYHYETFVGGILLLTREQFQQVNGMSNKYWGWGLEDDELYARIKQMGWNISRPTKLSTGYQNTFKHIHDRRKRKRDTAKLYNQKEVTRHLDIHSGLSNIRYNIAKTHHMMIDGAPISLFDVELICDTLETPWCDHLTDDSKKRSVPKTPAK